MKTHVKIACFLLLFFGFAGTSKDAFAVPDILSKNTKATTFQFDFGPTIAVYPFGGVAFKLSQAMLWHTNNTGKGLFIGGKVQESVTSGYFGLDVLFSVGYDVQPKKGLALLVGPTADIGMSFNTLTGVGVDFQISLPIKLILNDEWQVMFQPISILMGIGGFSGTVIFSVRYDILFGVGYRF